MTELTILQPEQYNLRYKSIEKYFRVFMEDVMGYDNPDFLNEIDDIISNKLYYKLVIALGRGNGKCLSIDSDILTDKGIKKLSDIIVGDVVYSVNKEGQIEKKHVLWKDNVGLKDVIAFKTKTGNFIKVSPEHRLLTSDGYKQAKDITYNDYLRIWQSDELLWDKVVSIETKEKEEMIDIQVEDNENFFANGIVSHNSTHLSVGFPLWQMALNHNIRILLVSSTSEMASLFLTQIMDNIENNKEYQNWSKWIDPRGKGVIPKMRKIMKKEEKWNSAALTIDRSSTQLKDPTIRAIGLGGSIVGKRADIVILDDLCTQENTQTEEAREKTKSWVRTTVMPVAIKGQSSDGRLIALGNIWHEDDLMMSFLKDPQFDYKKVLPAILHEANNQELWQEWAKIRTDESLGQSELSQEKRIKDSEEFYQQHKKEMDEGVELLFPQMFNYGDLYLERMADSYSFERMRMCNPANRPNQLFKESWLDNAKKKGASLRLSTEMPKGIDFELICLGLDLAASEKGDDNALSAMGRVRNSIVPLINPGDYVLLNMERGKLPQFTPKYVRDLAIEWDKIYHAVGIRVESNAYQKAMAIDLQDAGIPTRSYVTGGEKNDSTLGVNSLAIIAENGKLVIPYDLSDPRTIQISSQLINEMRKFPDGHTGDGLMSLWFAFSELRQSGGKTLSVPGITGVKKIPETQQTENQDLQLDLEAIAESENERIGEDREKEHIEAHSEDPPYVKRLTF